MNDISIVFMGTPEFAVASLQRIVESGYRVPAVVTVPDKPAGRGLKIRQSAVKQYALEHGIGVLQPDKLNDTGFLDELKNLGANLFVVVAFRKLPEAVWSLPELGCFNLHASLLPQYRGAAPINHAVMNGETVTGVTTFFINEGIDTGKIIMRSELPVGADETAGELHDRLKEAGAGLVLKTIENIAANKCFPTEQPLRNEPLRTAPRIFREQCFINWDKTAQEVHNLIRGLSPYPGAISFLTGETAGKEVKLLRSALTGEIAGTTPGYAKIVSDNRLFVACADQYIEITTIQPAGKKVMQAGEFLRGLRVTGIAFKTPSEAV